MCGGGGGMSEQNVSKKPQHVPRFDWDEARSRYASGERVADLAAEYGVTLAAIYRIVTPGLRESSNQRKDEWQRSGSCPDCGMQTTRRSAGYSSRCSRCAAVAKGTTARDGELHCNKCDQWKPDNEFPTDRRRIARRGRHRYCRSCLTIAKREWRERYPERAKAADRRAGERRKAAA